MTELLEKAFRLAAELSPEDQDKIASFLLAEIESERRWETLYEDSQESLARLAREALKDDAAGRTEDLVPDEL